MAILPAGVPALLDAASAVFLDPASVLSADTFGDYGAGAPPVWGIFQDGQPVVTPDTVASVSYSQDWAVADYPIEGGGFESYDKVNTPFRIQLTLVSGGSEANRQSLLDQVAAIGDPLTLYEVVTPEATYVSCNVDHYSYRRTSTNGLGLMIIDVHLLEIREDGQGQSPASPSGYAAQPAGNVQSTETTTDITVRPVSPQIGVQ